MAEETVEKRIREKMKQDRGHSSPQWEYVAERGVDFQEAYNNL